MARLTLRHRLARLHPLVWIGAVAAIGGLIAWPLGGWDTVELQSTKLPQVAPGELVPGHEFSVSVESAKLTTVHPDGFSEIEPGWTWFALELELTNETDITAFSSKLGDEYFGVVTIDDAVLGWGFADAPLDAEGNPERGDAYLVSDGKYLPGLQPALPTRVVVIFDVREGTWRIGDELVVGIVDRTPFESTLGTGTRYGDATLVAEVPITLEQGEQAPPSRARAGAHAVKRIPALLALAAFVVAAFLVHLTKPLDEDLQRPFVTYASFGQRAEGRDLTWIAEDAYLADRLITSEWIGDTEGIWLVIEGTIGSKLGVTSPDVSVLVGELRYIASDRPGDGALGESLDAGLPQSGAFAFELPRSVLDSPDGTYVTARFATGFRVRLDSAIDMVLDLTQLEHVESARLPEPGMVIAS